MFGWCTKFRGQEQVGPYIVPTASTTFSARDSGGQHEQCQCWWGFLEIRQRLRAGHGDEIDSRRSSRMARIPEQVLHFQRDRELESSSTTLISVQDDLKLGI